MHVRCRSVAATIIAAVQSILLLGSPAHAVNSLSFVSSQGSDANNCSTPAQACFSTEAAVNATGFYGTVKILGPYITGGQTIKRSVKIIGEDDVLFDAINIDSPDLDVRVEKIRFNGNGYFNYGVTVSASSKLSLSGCVFTGYSKAAVYLNGPAGARISIDDIQMSDNRYGVVVEGASGAANTAFIKDSFIDTSASSAVEVRGANSTAVLINSTLAGSGVLDLSRINGGKAISYGNNVIRSGTPSQTLSTN